MKLSKSILSPSHGRDPPLSLPPSLSRRLKTSSSIKSTTNKKQRGSSFENPEPSSPKVTCIGQVKLKTKKKAKQSRTSNLSLSSSSFRAPGVHVLNQQCVAHRNQRWVHFPLTICEALREFSCLFPCRSSCLYKEKKEKINRWLVVLQENPDQSKDNLRSSRRHVFEDIEFKDDEKEATAIIPPKNALLLMRCRSDPTKMADLTTRFEEDEENKNRGGNEHVEGLIDARELVIDEKCKISQETEKDILVHKTLTKKNDIPEPEKEEEEEEEERFVTETGLFEEIGAEERKSDAETSENGTKLPDCLLLMMFEPKLSMEVSRETWVCKSDFILPERKSVNKEKPERTVIQCTKHSAFMDDTEKHINEEQKMRTSIESKPARLAQDSRSQRLMQPPRSSCSVSMATMIEQKLVNATAYEPFVLTRCKSEPMRMVALAPESCFGAAGIGF